MGLGPPGVAFVPSDYDLISFYLLPAVSGQPLPPDTAAYIHSAPVYSAHPATLTSLYVPAPHTAVSPPTWFFLSSLKRAARGGSRISRTVGDGDGRWHPEQRARPVLDSGGSCVGYRKLFSFKTKTHGKSEWLMTQYSVGQEDGADMPAVLCKIYRTPRARGAEASAGSKRKAPDTVEPPEDAIRAQPRTKALRQEDDVPAGVHRDIFDLLMADDEPDTVPVLPQMERVPCWTEDDMKSLLVEDCSILCRTEGDTAASGHWDEAEASVAAPEISSWTGDATAASGPREVPELSVAAPEVSSWTGDATAAAGSWDEMEVPLLSPSRTAEMDMAFLDMAWLPSPSTCWAPEPFDPLPMCPVS